MGAHSTQRGRVRDQLGSDTSNATVSTIVVILEPKLQVRSPLYASAVLTLERGYVLDQAVSQEMALYRSLLLLPMS